MNNDKYDVIIIGGGPGGLSAAIYSSRARLKTLIVEDKRKTGGQCATTSELENYPGIIKDSGSALMDKFTQHARHFGAELIQGHVQSLTLSEDGLQKIVQLKEGENADGEKRRHCDRHSSPCAGDPRRKRFCRARRLLLRHL